VIVLRFLEKEDGGQVGQLIILIRKVIKSAVYRDIRRWRVSIFHGHSPPPFVTPCLFAIHCMYLVKRKSKVARPKNVPRHLFVAIHERVERFLGRFLGYLPNEVPIPVD